jgi:hypothetical protein
MAVLPGENEGGFETDANFYVIASAAKQSIVLQAEGWVASRSLSSGAHRATRWLAMMRIYLRYDFTIPRRDAPESCTKHPPKENRATVLEVAR